MLLVFLRWWRLFLISLTIWSNESSSSTAATRTSLREDTSRCVGIVGTILIILIFMNVKML